MKRGTPEGRRLFAVCVGVGLVLGVLAGTLAAVAFHGNFQVESCHPDDPNDYSVCKRLEFAGFDLHSSWNAGLTVGPVVAIVGWVFAVVCVLYSAGHHHPHQEQ